MTTWVSQVESKTVSIHASRCWEAMPHPCQRQQTASQFQSTPPVAGRRCYSGDAAATDTKCFNPRLPLLGGDALRGSPTTTICWVSIHASRCWEAMRSISLRLRFFRSFQSTPPVAGRRCPQPAASAPSATTFQSTPPVAGRRCHGTDRHRGSPRSFNPRLPLLGGDAFFN